MDELKQRAEALQAKLADEHARFSGSGAQQTDPAGAAAWQEQWQGQAREAGGLQDSLRRGEVGLHTRESLASAERSAQHLEERLQALQQQQQGGAK